MVGWIFTIDEKFPQHWDIAQRSGFWDVTKNYEVQEGDNIFFWQTGRNRGLRGHVRATQDMRALEPGEYQPWSPSDPRQYAYRVRFEVISNRIRKQPNWNDIQTTIKSKDHANKGVIKANSSAGTARLAAYFQHSEADLSWPPVAIDWNIAPGETLLRREIHDKYGGSRQGGIGPSRVSQNVLIFTDPAKGEAFGYNYDGWHDDGTFHYTGEGQVGDQSFRAGNKAIRDHLPNGRSLRVFESNGASTTYVGEFELADPGYEVADAPDRNGEMRSVIVFRLEPVTRALTTVGVTAPTATPGVVDLPIEANLAEKYAVSPHGESTERRRIEGALVNRYAAWLKAHGHDAGRKQITPAGELRPLFNDLYNHTARELIEAKGSTSRDAVRMAIGQVLDYARHVDHDGLAVLLPSRPREDLLALILSCYIACIWETVDGEFDRADP